MEQQLIVVLANETALTGGIVNSLFIFPGKKGNMNKLSFAKIIN